MKQHPYYKNILVTECGEVYSTMFNRMKKLKTQLNENGYISVSITVGVNQYKKERLHRIVAETYLPNPDNLREVDHLDCNKQNNHVSNLEWVSSKENKRRARLNGLYDNTVGEKHHNSILTEEIVHKICQCLQDGMRNKDVAEMLGIDRHLVGHIKIGDIWKNISSQYQLEVKRNKRKSIEFLQQVCLSIAEGLSDNQIYEKFNGEITYQDIRRIRAKTIHSSISASYF